MSQPVSGQGSRSPGTSSRSSRSGELSLTPLGVFTVSVSVTFLVAGIAWPDAAEAWLRMLVATLALGFVLARTYEAALPRQATQDSYSPFEGSTATAATGAAPKAIQQLTEMLGAADDPERAQRTAIPWTVGRTVIREASRRLAQDHDLRLDDTDDHTRIRSLVSEATWLLIRPGEQGSSPGEGAPAARQRSVPLSRLELILDDLEQL